MYYLKQKETNIEFSKRKLSVSKTNIIDSYCNLLFSTLMILIIQTSYL
jgi:hypothetical protein